MAPSSALPIGATRVVSEMQPVAVDPASGGSGLLNKVLALLAPANPDENERYDEEILDLPVAGFLIVYVGLILYILSTEIIISQNAHRHTTAEADYTCSESGIGSRENSYCWFV